MRIAFMGTPDFAVPTLDALIEAGHDVVAVYTQPPRRAGRGKALLPSPVQRRAEAAGIGVMTPATLRDAAAQAAFAALDLDVAVVAAYGLILPEPVLAAPRLGCLNVHASLLPRWRGAAPIHRAILAGDEMTGVCIMGMEKGLDTGPVYARRETEVDRKTAGELTTELAGLGGALMAEVLDRIGEIVPEPQPKEGVTYAAKIEKAEAKLEFSRPADAVARQIRAFNPVPGAFFEYQGERIRILAAQPCSREGGSPEKLDPTGEVRMSPGHPQPCPGDRATSQFRGGTVIDDDLTISCGIDAIRPTLVQRAGRAAMTPVELLRGFPIPPGAVLL